MAFEAPTRRSLLAVVPFLVAAPAVIRVAKLMPVKVWRKPAIYGDDMLLVEIKRYDGQVFKYATVLGRLEQLGIGEHVHIVSLVPNQPEQQRALLGSVQSLELVAAGQPVNADWPVF